MTKADKVTAPDVRAGLLRYFAKPECAVVFEVAQATGYDARRHLDAVAMELWPSRGLALHGVEIKVSLSDWRREKANPEKAEEIARFCDYFWIAAPAGLIPASELPSAWGLLELSGDTIVQRWAAQKTEAEGVDRPFVAALLRAGSRGIDPESAEAVLAKSRQALYAEFDKRVKEAVSLEIGRRKTDAASWAALCEAVGDTPDVWTGDKEIIAAVRLVLAAGVAKTYSGVRALSEALTNADREINGVLRDLGIAPKKPAKRRRKPARKGGAT